MQLKQLEVVIKKASYVVGSSKVGDRFFVTNKKENKPAHAIYVANNVLEKLFKTNAIEEAEVSQTAISAKEKEAKALADSLKAKLEEAEVQKAELEAELEALKAQPKTTKTTTKAKGTK